MRRILLAVLFSLTPLTSAQTAINTTPSSDPQALVLAQQSIAALTGGAAVGDVMLNASVTEMMGPSTETGTAVFIAKGTDESRVDLNLSTGATSEVRSVTSGRAAGTWNRNGGTAVPQAAHNMLTDAGWFFPALSCLRQFTNSSYVFKYLGQAQHGGVNTQHIQISHVAVPGAPFLPRLSSTDVYLSATNSLPVAVVFNAHPDNDMNKDIPVEILFANWQPLHGVQIPFHFQKVLNGGVILDATVTSASLNRGVADTAFTLP